MEFKKTNLTLISIVSILLIIVCLVLVKVLLSDSKGFAWGSVSDWFTAICSLLSAVGTLGTLYVAYKALIKAPEWLSQKHFDIVSKVIEEAIYEDLRKLSSLSIQYKSYIVHTSKTLKNCLNDREELPKDIGETLDKVENLLIEFFNLSYSIQNRLKAIQRYNYKITPYTVIIMNNIKHFADSYNTLQTQFELAASEVPMLMYADEETIRLTAKEINDIQIEAIELNHSLQDFVKSIYDDNKPITEFIEVIK